jgi:hypothetical protein
MPDVPFPILTAPGRQPQASGGRLINCFPEKLPDKAGKPYAYWRVPGLKQWGSSGGTNFRGALIVNNLIYAVINTTVYTYPLAGGAGTALTGTLPGTLPVSMARNNAATPDVVIVAPGDGAFIAAGGTVSGYPGVTVLIPNSVVFHRGFFIFTYGNGKSRASGVNTTTINALDEATAESKPDTLLRAIPLGNGQLLLCGDASLEVWGGDPNVGVAGYPFVYVATIARGIVGANAIAGNEDGWGKGIYLVGDDFKVSYLDGYTPTPVSSPDLDLLIENDPNKALIQLSVYVSMGHGFVVVKGTNWCWEYDTTLTSWHERKSYLKDTWRGKLPFRASNQWLCGDTDTGNIGQIDGNTKTEFTQPLRMRIETGPIGAFPNTARINGIELYLTKGVGIATGIDPLETDPSLEISISRDGGQTWTSPRIVKVGRQALTAQRVRAAIWGHADVQGVRWRFDLSAPVSFGFMGADMQVDVLR